MAEIREETRELTLRMAYFGPTGAGKGTNLRRLHEAFAPALRSRLKAVEIRGDRSLSFNLKLPVAVEGDTETWTLQLSLVGATGDIRSAQTRRNSLTDVDAIAFIGHSSRARQLENREAFRAGQGLITELYGDAPPPRVIQFGHTDAADALDDPEIEQEWGSESWPIFTAQAKAGRGVRETLMSMVKLAYEATLIRHPVLEKRGLYLDRVIDTLIAAMRSNP